MTQIQTDRALVLGGSGYVGAAVVRRLRAEGLEVCFSYLRSEARALALAEETGARPLRIDLSELGPLEQRLRALAAEGPFRCLIGCAAEAKVAPIAELDADAWERAHRIGPGAAYVAVRALAPGMRAAGGGEIVLVGALDRMQSLPLPAPFAAAQGALYALVMALAKELGAGGVRANLVALGPLEGGLSLALPAKLREDFLKYSALRRFGSAEEAAGAIAWLALRNRYMSGKVLPVNGGL